MGRDPIERVEHDGELFSLIVRADFDAKGVTFFTPTSLSQQLAYMHHPVGKAIEPHVHLPVSREVVYTQETLFIRRGRLRVDFFDKERRHLESRVVGAGDVILLVQGGHGFEVLEEVELFEVKQGPYSGEGDRSRFRAVLEEPGIR